MKTINKKIKLFSFDELSEKAKEKVIAETINFYLEIIPYEDMSGAMKRACDKAEEMKTPWFAGEYVNEYCREEIIQELRDSGESYTKDGEYFVG